MEPLLGILGIVKTYLDRCVKCDTGRKGSCPWLRSFQTLDFTASTGASTPEDRAIAAQEITGSPCSDQMTFDEFIDQIDSYAASAQMPRDEAELISILTRLETSLTRLKRLPKNYRPAFADSVTAAIEHILAALDFAGLTHGLTIEHLIHGIHPGYDRAQMFARCGYPGLFVKTFSDLATTYNLKGFQATPQAEDPVATSAADLPDELSTPEAMTIWNKAREAGLVDNHYHFTSKSKTELAVFAGSFSTELFGEIRWKPFREWQPYDYYPKAYSEYSNRKTRSDSPAMQSIRRIFSLG